MLFKNKTLCTFIYIYIVYIVELILVKKKIVCLGSLKSANSVIVEVLEHVFLLKFEYIYIERERGREKTYILINNE